MSCRIPEFRVTRDQFLSSLGGLQDVNIKKVGDRISLAFTQTTPIISLSEDQIIAIPGTLWCAVLVVSVCRNSNQMI